MRRTTPLKTNIIIAIIVALAVGAGFVITNRNPGAPVQKNDTAQQQAPTSVPAETTYISYEGVEGQTALSLLKLKATVVTKESSLGEFVV